MSHEPPIPEAARSPYPLQQPPITVQDESAQTDGQSADGDGAPDGASEQSWTGRARDTFDRATESKVALGAAVGIGSAALLAALLFSRRGGGKGGRTAAASATPGEGQGTRA